MDEEAAFLAGIRKQPDNATSRLVYADWLEEQGDPISLMKARYLRLDHEFATRPDQDREGDTVVRDLRVLSGLLETQWKQDVGRFLVENCDIKWEFQCPKSWDKMTPTEDDKVRHCDACNKKVYYCGDLESLRLLVILGHCVAIDRRFTIADAADSIRLHTIDGAGEYMTAGVLIPPEGWGVQDDLLTTAPQRRSWLRRFSDWLRPGRE